LELFSLRLTVKEVCKEITYRVHREHEDLPGFWKIRNSLKENIGQDLQDKQDIFQTAPEERPEACIRFAESGGKCYR